MTPLLFAQISREVSVEETSWVASTRTALRKVLEPLVGLVASADLTVNESLELFDGESSSPKQIANNISAHTDTGLSARKLERTIARVMKATNKYPLSPLRAPNAFGARVIEQSEHRSITRRAEHFAQALGWCAVTDHDELVFLGSLAQR